MTKSEKTNKAFVFFPQVGYFLSGVPDECCIEDGSVAVDWICKQITGESLDNIFFKDILT